MKYDLYGRKTLEVIRQKNKWQAFYNEGLGIKRSARDVQIPDSILEGELIEYLEDIFHEWATPERPSITRL